MPKALLSATCGLCLLCSCAFQMAISNQGFATLMSAGDLRIGWKSSRAADVEVEASKEEASDQFMEALPAIVEDAVRAAIVACGAGAVSGAAGALTSCAIPKAATPTEGE